MWCIFSSHRESSSSTRGGIKDTSRQRESSLPSTRVQRRRFFVGGGGRGVAKTPPPRLVKEERPALWTRRLFSSVRATKKGARFSFEGSDWCSRKRSLRTGMTTNAWTLGSPSKWATRGDEEDARANDIGAVHSFVDAVENASGFSGGQHGGGGGTFLSQSAAGNDGGGLPQRMPPHSPPRANFYSPAIPIGLNPTAATTMNATQQQQQQQQHQQQQQQQMKTITHAHTYELVYIQSVHKVSVYYSQGVIEKK